MPTAERFWAIRSRLVSEEINMFTPIALVALFAVFAACFLRAAKRHRPKRISPELAALLRMNPRTREAKLAYLKAFQRYARKGGADDLSGPD